MVVSRKDANPATIGALTHLMLGGLPTGREGYPLHCRVRYFDPVRPYGNEPTTRVVDIPITLAR